MLALELRQHAPGVHQAKFMKGRIGQHATPAVKNHHCLGTSLDLAVQIQRHRVGIDGQHLVQQVGALVEHGLDQPVIV